MNYKELSVVFVVWVNTFLLLNLSFEFLEMKVVLSVIGGGVFMTGVYYFFYKKKVDK